MERGWSRSAEPIAGFRRWRAAGRLLVVAEAFEDAIGQTDLLAPGGFERALAEPSGPDGRGSTSILRLTDGRRLHLRPIRHGGWLGGLRGRALIGLRRPLGELAVTLSLARAGAPVANPVLVMADRVGPFWSASLGTEYESEAIDLGALLASGADRDRIARAADAAGRAVRLFHDRGGSHRDLHLGNLLVRGDEVIVIDLDRARRLARVGAARRMRELARLYRSVIKRGFAGRVGRRGVARFFAAYSQGDRSLRAALLSQLPRERRRVARHTRFYPDRSDAKTVEPVSSSDR